MKLCKVHRAIFLALLLCLVSCVQNRKVTEISRTASPSQTVDAILGEPITHSTVARQTEVYIVLKGQPLDNQPVFRADHAVGVKLIWESESELTIAADKARIFLQEPSKELTMSDGSRKPVSIKLAIKVTEP